MGWLLFENQVSSCRPLLQGTTVCALATMKQARYGEGNSLSICLQNVLQFQSFGTLLATVFGSLLLLAAGFIGVLGVEEVCS